MAESVLKDLGTYKNTLITALLQSPVICKGLLNKVYTADDVDNLVYTQIFPYLYVDETQDVVLPYICIEADIPSVPTGTVKDVSLTIWVYAHKECMKYHEKDYVGTRVDILADSIDRIISDEQICYEFGIGKPELRNVNHFFPQSKYYGRIMTYKIPEFKVKK